MEDVQKSFEIGVVTNSPNAVNVRIYFATFFHGFLSWTFLFFVMMEDVKTNNPVMGINLINKWNE